MFHISNSDDIKEGKITDVYFERTVRILKKKRLDKRVVVEVRTRTLPSPYQWAILGGLHEALCLLVGLEIDVWSMSDGTIFHPFEPVL
ncbi:unnamed protein product, partial [marine sediment metagenome]